MPWDCVLLHLLFPLTAVFAEQKLNANLFSGFELKTHNHLFSKVRSEADIIDINFFSGLHVNCCLTKQEGHWWIFTISSFLSFLCNYMPILYQLTRKILYYLYLSRYFCKSRNCKENIYWFNTAIFPHLHDVCSHGSFVKDDMKIDGLSLGGLKLAGLRLEKPVKESWCQ